MDRSSQESVRNPLVALPSAAKFAALPDDVKALLLALMREASDDARARAEKSWKTHKGPLAAYWKTWAVNLRHASRLLNRSVGAQPENAAGVPTVLVELDAAGVSRAITSAPARVFVIDRLDDPADPRWIPDPDDPESTIRVGVQELSPTVDPSHVAEFHEMLVDEASLCDDEPVRASRPRA